MIHDGCFRSQVNRAYCLTLINALHEASEAIQRTICGCTTNEVQAGTGHFPTGFWGAAESVGRWIEVGGDKGQAVEIVTDARKRNISFGDIAKHFRNLRLGEKKGNAISLTIALARTLDEYQKTFPKTTMQQRRAALMSLLEDLEEDQS